MMKNKDRLQMYMSLTKITIILCWLSLFSFWAIKLFGGNWFEIMVENENFVKFSNTVQNTWLKYLVSLITIGVANYLILGGVAQKLIFKGKELAIVTLLILSMWVVANFVPLSFLYLPSYYGYFIILGIGIYYHKGIKRLLGLFAIVLEIVFSTISMLVRNISLEVLSNYFIAYVLSIDVYLMILLYYLYSNLINFIKENNEMIVIGHGWLGKEEAQENGYNAWKRFWHNVGYVVTFKWARKAK